MRQLLASILGLILTVALVGCHHTAGLCDGGCDGGYGGAVEDVSAMPAMPGMPAASAMPPVAPETKAMPRGEKISAPVETAP